MNSEGPKILNHPEFIWDHNDLQGREARGWAAYSRVPAKKTKEDAMKQREMKREQEKIEHVNKFDFPK